MKQLAVKKRQPLALMPVTQPIPVPAEDPGLSLVKAFRGWLAPYPMNADGPKVRPLTTEDFVQVELATIRESRSHAIWPTEVIARFLDAELDIQ